MIIGFDIGGTNIRALLVDPNSGEIFSRTQGSSAGSENQLLETLVELVEFLKTQSSEEVTGIGLAIAGLISHDGVVHYSPNLPNLLEFPIGARLQDLTSLPVFVGNDATAGAWAEAQLGAGRGIDNFAFVALGTGIGTGLVVNKNIVLGAHGFAGEAGHATTNSDGPTHITGLNGSWEYFASGNALGRLGRQASKQGEFALGLELAGSEEQITGLHVSEGLIIGDQQSLVIFDEFCRQVAIGISNLITILDTEQVILGGGLVQIGDLLVAGVEKWLPEFMFGWEYRPQVPIRLAELGMDAGSLGASLLVNEIGENRE
ncbi:MAG TPA: ROK family protein [Acidimicrobiales bacterium]|nr:ROK family protein [Acidimicrobiales bacterium]|tara:strand:+ start:345 stop:1295 length:951 start_codon:yes stop_codon:yes gene_type:complete